MKCECQNICGSKLVIEISYEGMLKKMTRAIRWRDRICEIFTIRVKNAFISWETNNKFYIMLVALKYWENDDADDALFFGGRCAFLGS